MSSALIYKMRLTAPNKPGTASHNSNYVKYIAEREHVMKLSPESESGLFGRIDGTNNDELDVTDTQNYVYGISKAGVTVYNAYISFRPEIAKRLELDSLEKWQNYIKFHIDTLMRGYDIPKDRFEYIAAVHDKKGQPHIHISFWDKDPPLTVQFVKKEVSDNVRKKLIHDTFANELSYYYGISNEAMSDAKELVGKLMIDFERDISGIYSNRFSGVDIPEELIQKYTDVLNNLPGRGRIAYAYLPKETKDMVIGMISLLIFCDIFNANISFTRKNALFILVYNEEKNKKKNNTTNGDEYGKDEMKDHIYGLAKEHEIRFGLERYRGLYFCDVFTYGKAEFNNVLNDILD